MLTLQSRNLGSGSCLEYMPLGGAAIISPWNYPLAMANNLLFPALVAGNGLNFKHFKATPLIAEEFVNTLNSLQPERYIKPTVICDMTQEMLLEHEETFGPVVAISRCADIESAIERANDSNDGLGAVVFGGQQAASLADRLGLEWSASISGPT